MNELVLVEKIEKKLQEKREPTVFPLASNHRKELRNLRDENIGNLRDRLQIIRRLKEEEYLKKHDVAISKNLKGYENMCKKLNADWQKRVDTIRQLIQQRKILEKTANLNNVDINSDYGDIPKLNDLKELKREFIFNKERALKEIGKEEFDDKFGKAFNAVDEKIDDVHTKYEEAINFGDLEIVKTLYYIMKKADSFFVKIDKLQV